MHECASVCVEPAAGDRLAVWNPRPLAQVTPPGRQRGLRPSHSTLNQSGNGNRAFRLPRKPSACHAYIMDEPLRILGVIEQDVTTPRRDGLMTIHEYDVPLRLSREPTKAEASHITEMWTNPQVNRNLHRAVRAKMDGDRLVLTRTTIEEIRDLHAETLRAILTSTNLRTAEEQRRQAIEADSLAKHQAHVAAIAKDIDFG